MARCLQLSVPSEETDHVLNALRQQDGLLNLAIQRNGGILPPGDIITLQISSRRYLAITKLLDELGIGRRTGTSIVATEPEWLASPQAARAVSTDPSVAVWEEMEVTLAKESHLNAITVGLMFIAGFGAATGVASGSIHVVAGAMVIAPGFEPIARIALGGVTRSSAWRRGLAAAVGGYLALFAGAACAAALLKAAGVSLLAGNEGYESTAQLVRYWSTLSMPAIVVSAMAAIAGALLIISHRSVLTAGVMLSLALVPAAALVPLAAWAGDLARAQGALMRWGVDVVLVFLAAGAVFWWRRRSADRKSMML